MYRLHFHKKRENLIAWDSRDNHNLSDIEFFKNIAYFIWLYLLIFGVLDHILFFNVFVVKKHRF